MNIAKKNSQKSSCDLLKIGRTAVEFAHARATIFIVDIKVKLRNRDNSFVLYPRLVAARFRKCVY